MLGNLQAFLWSFAIIRDRGNTGRPNHVILEFAHTGVEASNTDGSDVTRGMFGISESVFRLL